MSSLYSQHSHDDGQFAQSSSGHTVSKSEASVNLKQREDHIYILPRNQVPTTCFQSGTLDVEFEFPQSLDYLDCCFLEYQLSNGSGSAANLVDGFEHFEFCTVLINETETATYYGQVLRNLYLLSHIQEKRACIDPQVGITGVDSSANLVLAGTGGTGTVRTPIFTFISEAEVPLWRPQTRVKLRFRLRTGSSLIRSAGAAITDVSLVSGSMKLLCQGQVLAPFVRDSHDAHLNSGGFKTFKFLEHHQQHMALGNLTSGTPVTFNYTASGQLSSYFLHTNVAGATGAQLYDSSTINSWDFLVSGVIQGHNLGDNNYTSGYARAIASKHWSNTEPLLDRTIYQFSFSEKPQYDAIHGSNFGTLPVHGNTETIRIVPGANVTSAVATVWGLYHSNIEIDYMRGQLRVARRVV